MRGRWFGARRHRFAARGLLALAALAFAVIGSSPAGAVPSFAVQTGQPCQACHVGGFGPQLTPFGRSFKLGGYTQRAVSFNLPVSVMAVASYVKTAKDQPSAPDPRFRPNDNTALDQVSLFVAGGLGQHLGAFVQTTYDGVAKAWSWDNIDVRAVGRTEIKGADVLYGASLNNGPTVQDVWNTLPAWGYPYTGSALAPSPSASPLIAGALAANSLGLTGYVWINGQVFIEGGGYGSPGATTLTHLGADPTSPGSIRGLAPYGRVAYERPIGAGTLEVGLFGMRTEIYPGLDRSSGLSDRYTDFGIDASYQTTFANGDVVTVNGRYIDERQSLKASCASDPDPGGCADVTLRDLRADASYYWRDKIGLTVAAFDTTGSANPTVYAANRTAKPDSTGLMVQLDGTPFGGAGSPLGPRFNVRVGVQYTMYSRFNGAGSNFDSAGANAADNNTFRVFTWRAY